MNALFGQLLIGLINGSFYALLSMGLAIIFGMLNIVNFAHGAQYMLGAFVSWMLLNYLGIGFWWALLLAPLLAAIVGIVLERLLISRVYKMDHLYGLLLTFGLALIIQGLFRIKYGSAGLPYSIPDELRGGWNLGFMYLPNYRAWVVASSLVICVVSWCVIEKTKLGSYLRAATENPVLVGAFGINVPRMITLTYGAGVGLAALAGSLAAPIFSVSPNMGIDIINIVFAVVVIGGMGSIGGSIATGIGLGLIEGLTKYLYPAGSTTVIFVVMVAVLISRPEGLFGKGGPSRGQGLLHNEDTGEWSDFVSPKLTSIIILLALVAAASIPFVVYPAFAMKVLCFAIFASAFNLMFGFGGLLSFGHAAYFGIAAYMCGYAAKTWGVNPEVAILFGVACSTVLGFVLGSLATRRQGIYFAMITLALAQMVFFMCIQTKALGGEDGLQAIPRGSLFGLISLEDDRTFYFFVLAIIVASLWFVHRVVKSPFGQVLKAIRDNEARATSLGYQVNRYKVLVFTLSAGLAGLGGALKALSVQLATLTDVASGTSADVVVMTLVGGIGTIFGPAIGAIVISSMEYYLAPFGAWVTVVQGVIFIVCVLAFREGIAGAAKKIFGRRRASAVVLVPSPAPASV